MAALDWLGLYKLLPTREAQLAAMAADFKSVDVDCSRSLDEYEFLRYYALLEDHLAAQREHTSRAEAAFRHYDTNLSGSIDLVRPRKAPDRAACSVLTEACAPLVA